MQKNNLNRREWIISGISGLASIILAKCSQSSFQDLTNGTGVSGLNSPSEILSNPYVGFAVREIERRGHSLELSSALNPPVISGKYEISGQQLFPQNYSLSPGTLTWRNQTADNHIDTDYNQLVGQSGVSSIGEIIRGQGNQFTVYSILNINAQSYGCRETAVLIIDGNQDNSGNIKSKYLATPPNESECLAVSGGLLDLTLVGSAKNMIHQPGTFGLISKANS